MTVITQEDFIESIADSLQYVSFFHPPDFIRAMTRAYNREQSDAARNAIAQILINSRMAAEGRHAKGAEILKATRVEVTEGETLDSMRAEWGRTNQGRVV